MKLKQTYKNHFKLIGFNFTLLLIILGSFIYCYFFTISEYLVFWIFYTGPLLLIINLLTYIIYIRYLLFENDTVYALHNAKIEIKRKSKSTTILIEDIQEVVFNGGPFIFEKFNPGRKLPWSDFYFLEIGLKNGEWIAITNIVHKDILEVFRNQYPNLNYKMNRSFYPLMTMY